jgi:F-type H+-transporting ATPase subunit delta
VSAVKVDAVTARWAEALFNLATDAGALESVQDDLEVIGREFQSPAVRTFLLGSQATANEKLAKLGGVTTGFHALTRNFVSLAFDRNRVEVLADAAVAFRRRSLDRAGVVEGVVESPRSLESADVHALETSLGGRLGKTVRLTQSTAPDLIGGVRVTVGANMIDASVQGRLDGLRRTMLEAPLPVPSAD